MLNSISRENEFPCESIQNTGFKLMEPAAKILSILYPDFHLECLLLKEILLQVIGQLEHLKA